MFNGHKNRIDKNSGHNKVLKRFVIDKFAHCASHFEECRVGSTPGHRAKATAEQQLQTGRVACVAPLHMLYVAALHLVDFLDEAEYELATSDQNRFQRAYLFRHWLVDNDFIAGRFQLSFFFELHGHDFVFVLFGHRELHRYDHHKHVKQAEGAKLSIAYKIWLIY